MCWQLGQPWALTVIPVLVWSRREEPAKLIVATVGYSWYLPAGRRQWFIFPRKATHSEYGVASPAIMYLSIQASCMITKQLIHRQGNPYYIASCSAHSSIQSCVNRPTQGLWQGGAVLSHRIFQNWKGPLETQIFLGSDSKDATLWSHYPDAPGAFWDWGWWALISTSIKALSFYMGGLFCDILFE